MGGFFNPGFETRDKMRIIIKIGFDSIVNKIPKRNPKSE